MDTTDSGTEPATDWDVVVVGGANVDSLVRGTRLPRPGETLEGTEFQEAPGGKGANQAVAAARLGARVALVARIGSDSRGDTLLTRLREEGVDTRYVVRDPEAQTGAALIMVEQAGEKSIFAFPGANHRFQLSDVDAASRALRSTRVLLVQLETPLECVAEAVRRARAAGSRVVLDPAPAIPLPDDLLASLNVIRPNSSEAEVLTGIPVNDRASARRAANQLLKRGAGAAVVQAGVEGNLLVGSDWELFFPRIPAASVDATGAGDAFAAALAVGLAEDASLQEAAAWGSAAAALATTRVGAQAGLPHRAEVLALLERGGPGPHTLERGHAHG